MGNKEAKGKKCYVCEQKLEGETSPIEILVPRIPRYLCESCDIAIGKTYAQIKAFTYNNTCRCNRCYAWCKTRYYKEGIPIVMCPSCYNAYQTREANAVLFRRRLDTNCYVCDEQAPQPNKY